MKRILVVLAMLAMVSPLLADDLMDYCIWWQVGESYAGSAGGPVAATGDSGWGFDAARLMATLDDSSNVEIGWRESGSATSVSSLTPETPASLADLSCPIQSFYVEFYALEEGGGEILLGRSNPTEWAQVVSAVDDFRGTGSSGGTLSHTGGYSPTGYAVPEPTSGLLLLMGAAALALRRRRASGRRH